MPWRHMWSASDDRRDHSRVPVDRLALCREGRQLVNWPWVSRKTHEEKLAEIDELIRVHAELKQGYISASEARDSAMKAGEAIAHRLAACDLERIETKANFAKLAALAKQLETKLQDCTNPPITTAELQKLTKRMAVLQTERDVLTEKCTSMEAKLAANEARMVKVEQLALAQEEGYVQKDQHAEFSARMASR